MSYFNITKQLDVLRLILKDLFLKFLILLFKLINLCFRNFLLMLVLIWNLILKLSKFIYF